MLIYVERLKQVYWPEWVAKIAADRRIDRLKPQIEHESFGRTRFYDVKRVRYFLDELRAGRELDPVQIDTDIHQYRVGSPISYGAPIITDGHHRFIAYVLMQREKMEAHCGGLEVHAEWLSGKRAEYVVDPNE